MRQLLPPGGATGGDLLYSDIHAPRDLLPELASARALIRKSRRGSIGELILLTSNYGQYDLAVNLVAQLAALGLHNYIILGDNRELALHAKRRRAIAVVWSSMLDRYATWSPSLSPECPEWCGAIGKVSDGRATHVGANRSGSNRTARDLRTCSARCPQPPAVFYRADSVRRLWLMRWHYTSRLLSLRYNVLLLDSDSLVLADPYPLLRQPPQHCDT